ncbi:MULTISPECIES: CIA30 family protein [unclassified Synechococcus]|jgi:hypothetical protein|uniref:CIA30 family protein n=1 Tax=unclassified Synechococcus TaxID=2626047 RepID=UPI0018CEADD7|nr:MULTISPECIES: CIA30 family protein [unclassified Synechococcus]MEA5422955.1 CIA30 family protein [Synechococcus sp. CCY9202]QPN59450.1 CIA30 family protein [Synechococcus sp. CBW1002]QPN66180.1 CIA30 family protein [Synechococcus sp. CBW1006]CAK6695180.1 hypothetical protein IFHNHDMJ_01773 [Synechococcus sp. CBW1107]
MASSSPSTEKPASLTLVAGDGFSGWHALNDTVMGGQSRGSTQAGSGGLVFDGEVIEAGGGFISCRSPVFGPPLDLSAYAAFELDLRADGRRYKLAVACADGLGGMTELIPGGLRWVAEFATQPAGELSRIRIAFADLRPSVRARPLGLPLRFDPSRITRLQLLHSRFADDGGSNSGFRAGPIHLVIEAIRAVA